MNIKKICVVGTGTMAKGIIQTFAQTGYPVIVKGRPGKTYDTLEDTINKGLARLVSKGKMEQAAMDKTLANITKVTEYSDCSEADLIIEAIAEDMETKHATFKEIQEYAKDDAILSTNTSSLSIMEVASKINNSERVIGMHFFNPVPLMKLVEIIKGQLTSEEVIDAIYDLANLLGILPMVDKEITDQLVKTLTKKGITLNTGAGVSEIRENSVLFNKDGNTVEIPASTVLMAVGRNANTEGLNLEAAGIKTVNGAIETNSRLEINVSNIYAIGDVNGKSLLAHTASMEGLITVENICGHNKEMDYSKIPSAIYIQPEIASVGLTEEQAAEKYKNIKVGKFPMFANGKAKVAGEEEGIIKVIVDADTDKILGVHMYCIHATDMISEAVATMSLGATAKEMINIIHPHPTVSEAIHEAFHASVDKAIHFI